MQRFIAMAVGLWTVWMVAGCQAPLAPAPVAAERAVEASVRLGGTYRTLAVVAAHTATTIDHVRLSLSVRNAQGQYVATGASRAIAQAALAAPVSLGNLKLGQAYRVLASAYADAAETQLVSDPAGSVTDFAMPALTSALGVATVDDTPVSLALKVRLLDATYAGRATFSVTVAGNIRSKTDSLGLTLYQVTGSTPTAIFTRTVPYTSGSPSFTVTNLRHGTQYALVAEGFDAGKKLSNDQKSTVSFTVPSPSNGQLNDDVNALVGAIVVDCSK